jgi:hypothetical protein
LLVALATVGILTGLVLSAVQRVRSAAARTDCQNRMRQLAIGLHAAHDLLGRLPPGHRSAGHPDRMRFSGWPTALLGALEQGRLAADVRAAYAADPNPFHSPPHTARSRVVRAFICPADDRTARPQIDPVTGKAVALLSYLGVSGRNGGSGDGLLYQDAGTRLSDVADGTSNS